MSKFIVAGIVQKETIVKVDSIPIQYKPVTDIFNSIHTSIGGDAYNESLALKWLGNSVDFFSLIGQNDSEDMINPPESEVKLFTDYVLPRLSATPAAVILYDKERRQQIFEDIKNLRDTPHNIDLFRSRLPAADMVVLANANFCRPMIYEAQNAKKRIAVNIRNYKLETLQYNKDFLAAADILYLSDDTLVGDPYEFTKLIVEEYDPEIVILGQGPSGLLMYSKNNNTYAHYNSVKTNEVVNTAGAGNALFSCFLHYYNQTNDAVLAIKNALLFASYKIGFLGTSNGFMTQQQIEDWRTLIWK